MTASRQSGTSLDDALDRLQHAHFYGEKLTPREQRALTRFIAERQGGPGAYAGSFALTAPERKAGIRAFTGELFTSASARHIAGEECCRVLATLRGRDPRVERALAAARGNLASRILPGVDASPNAGAFCCGKCTVAFWRHIAAGGFNAPQQRLAEGMRLLRSRRDGKGGWRRFPFYYTLLALTEIGPGLAGHELKYASTVFKRRLARKPGPDKYARRRHDIMARAAAIV